MQPLSSRHVPLAPAVLAAMALWCEGLHAQDTTEVVILGVSHSAMLVAESYQPAVFRAYMDRVDADAICIERSPEEFARGSHYEFTYEIQDIAVPYARERRIELCPFDWLPADEDQALAYGISLEEPPFVRGPQTWMNFVTFGDSTELERDLFYAESPAERDRHRAWYLNMMERPRQDFARRLFLYRTFMQAMRIARAAAAHPGGRVLVLVGSFHKDDLERILADQPRIRIVPPPRFGAPTAEEIAAHVRLDDFAAIATFNLLGAQSRTGNIDRAWLERVMERLERERPGPESRLLRTRLEVLVNELEPRAAVDRYREIRENADAAVRFTWDGVLDRRRIDSFADPFGNLTVRQRAALEEVRESLRAGDTARAETVRAELESTLPPLGLAQLRAYWSEWLVR
ncbi:MAG TPA: hypothetical protein VFZ24_12600 [Longimicrobiales bacterium]